VLVNGGSASASEIVAGALKNLDRGVIIGKRTFGKGSVQVLYDNDDGSALKLTIAQYLTPGDVSIQTVGITPDVLTDPVVIRPKYIRLRHGDDAPREKDLAKHLTHRNAASGGKPSRRVRYLAVATSKKKKKKAKLDDKQKKARKNLCLFPNRSCKPPEDEKFVVDFQIRLARDLLASAKGWRASQLLAGSKRLFARVDVEQERRIAQAIKKLNVDWSEAPKQARLSLPPGASAPRLAVKMVTDPPGGVVSACRSTTLRVTVKNIGGTAAHRLRAITESQNGLLDKRELLFGRLGPGDERSWEVPLRLRDAPTRVDEVKLRFFDDSKTRYPLHRGSLRSKGVDRPVFAYGYQLIDDIKGNLDGQVQRGEHVRLFVRVKNSGKGPAFRAVTRLKNLAGVGIFIRKGRFVLGKLEPGQSKTAAFTFEVQPGYRKRNFKLELAVVDTGLREYVSEKLAFTVAQGSLAPKPAKGWVRVDKPRAEFRAWGAAAAPVVGSAKRGSAFRVLGRTADGWYRVAATKQRPAFLSPKAVSSSSRAAARRKGFRLRWQVTPPTIALKVPTLATSKPKLRIHGSAHDETRLQDLYIFVRNPKAKISGRKIFYRSNRKSKKPKTIDFAVDVPLWPGANYVTVFARESNDTQSQETVVIFRKVNKPAVAKVKPATKAQPLSR
jgi:carboxyl-terminal processing protease